MRIVIAGGTGFVGKGLIRALLAHGHEIVPLVRPGSESKLAADLREKAIIADPGKPLDHIDTTANVLINAVGIIREFPSKGITFQKIHVEIARNLVDFAINSEIHRFIQISALGVGPESTTGYQKSKFAAEEYTRQSRLKWTILRPSMIVGPGAEAILMFAKMIRLLPVVPVIGDGDYKLQPVGLDDLAEGVVRSLADERSHSRIFEIGGPDILTFNHMLDEIGKALGKNQVWKIRQPVVLMRLFASIFGGFSWFPATNEQITMLIDDNYTSETSFFDIFEIHPRPFQEALTGVFER